MRTELVCVTSAVFGVGVALAYVNFGQSLGPQGAIATPPPTVATVEDETLTAAAWALRAQAGKDPEIGVMALNDAGKVQVYLARVEAENLRAIAQALGDRRVIERAKELGRK